MSTKSLRILVLSFVFAIVGYSIVSVSAQSQPIAEAMWKQIRGRYVLNHQTWARWIDSEDECRSVDGDWEKAESPGPNELPAICLIDSEDVVQFKKQGGKNYMFVNSVVGNGRQCEFQGKLRFEEGRFLSTVRVKNYEGKTRYCTVEAKFGGKEVTVSQLGEAGENGCSEFCGFGGYISVEGAEKVKKSSKR